MRTMTRLPGAFSAILSSSCSPSKVIRSTPWVTAAAMDEAGLMVLAKMRRSGDAPAARAVWISPMLATSKPAPAATITLSTSGCGLALMA